MLHLCRLKWLYSLYILVTLFKRYWSAEMFINCIHLPSEVTLRSYTYFVSLWLLRLQSEQQTVKGKKFLLVSSVAKLSLTWTRSQGERFGVINHLRNATFSNGCKLYGNSLILLLLITRLHFPETNLDPTWKTGWIWIT